VDQEIKQNHVGSVNHHQLQIRDFFFSPFVTSFGGEERPERIGGDMVAHAEELEEAIDDGAEGGEVCHLVNMEVGCENGNINDIDDGSIHVYPIDREGAPQTGMEAMVMDGMGASPMFVVDLVRR